ncbi:MAG TPA: BON domain-containing protein [Verrucomicrobiae bacterium]|nr:BON domain-containing protein [Verrucomicrobiae bacterium]
MKSASFLALLAVTSAWLATSVPARASETDDRIVSSAKKSYVFKTYLKDDSIKTESRDGAVLLTGTVEDDFHSSLAQDTVEGLPGVKSVNNQLRVRRNRPAAHTDSWLVVKVKSALLFHRNVSATGTEISVRQGVATLHGEASSAAQSELTAEYVRDVDGIKDVKNEMTIAKGTPRATDTLDDKMDDASITAQVKASLLAHRSTSAVRTKIETTDGVVIVSGVAKNAAEKSLVTKLVNDINGVDSVVNNMTFAVPVAAN